MYSLLMTDERKNLHDQLDTLLASDIDKTDVETALKQLLATQSERSSEPILQESENRYVLLPIKYPDVWELYQKAVASFWVPNEVDLKSDVEDWESKLNSNEREFIKNVLAFFAASDFIVNENLVERFSSEIMIPEAKCFYAFQSAMESIHCVAPETKILTSNGYFRIDKLVDMAVDVWNGHEFSEVYVKKTSECAEVLCVKLSNGMQLQCTTEHKWLVLDQEGGTVRIPTKDLRAGRALAPYVFPPTMNLQDGPHHVDGYDLPKYVPINYSVETKVNYLAQLVDVLSPTYGGAFIRSKDVKLLWDVQLLLTTLEIFSDIHDGALFIGQIGLDRLKSLGFSPRMEPADIEDNGCIYVVGVEDSGRHCATYCFNEPERHTGCFNGIVTGQSETYALLLDTFIKNPKEKHEALNAITTIPCIKKKADWARKWTSDKDSTFAKRLVAFAIVEGVHFSGSFCALFWLRKRNLMKGLTFSNSLIARDEGLHTDHACLLYTHLRNRLSDEEAHTIMKEAVDIEKEFICDSLKVSLLGMNSVSMKQYIEFVADRLLSQLGHPKVFKSKCPFDWMNLTSMRSKENFFESRVSSYEKANIGLSHEEMEFGMDEEF